MTRPGAAVLVALALLVLPLPAPAQSPPAAPLTPAQSALREIYQELLEINTTDSAGDTTAAAQAMAVRLRAGGFADSEMRIVVPPGAPRKGHLVARLKGRGTGTPEAGPQD